MPKANKNKVAGPGTTGSARTSQENQERYDDLLALASYELLFLLIIPLISMVC
jgi:hypothetical protein